MKQTFTALLLLALAATAPAQTIFSYGNHTVGKEEFLHAYNKNNSNPVNNEKAYRDYLELYIRFKLKVQAAYDARLDTLPAQKLELVTFRSQIIDSYLNDEKTQNELVQEAFGRSQRDLRVSHIFIPFSGTDTLAAYKKAHEAYEKLKKGADFAATALEYSSDNGVQVNKGDIGYITVFTLPYELETLAYSTPEGKFSAPYRGRSAYHIFKITAARPAVGHIKAAQILLAFPPGAGPAEKEKTRLLADSIYDALQKGASFKVLVKLFSNDNISYQAEGMMPEFGIGRFDLAFETAAFGLQQDGQISRPVLTNLGYHIIQRLGRVPVNRNPHDKDAMALLRQQVLADKRIGLAKKRLAEKISRNAGFKKAKYDPLALQTYGDSALNHNKKISLPGFGNRTELFSFPGNPVVAEKFADYLQSVKNTPEVSKGKTISQLLDQFTQDQAIEYYRAHLEQYDPAFAFQIREFKDGNLLFEVMQRNVWDQAAADSTGQKNYFNAHKDNYWWGPSADVILFTCSDSAHGAGPREEFMKNHANWKGIVMNSDGSVQADSARFELSQIPGGNNPGVAPGYLTPLIKNNNDNITSFTYFVKLYPQKAPREFNDAKGFVLNDYQNFLENAWIENLKKKYPVTINETALAGLWKK